MALDLDDIRGEKRKGSQPSKLSRDAREARNASRELEDSTGNDNGAIAATLSRIEGMVTGLTQTNNEVLDKIEMVTKKADAAVSQAKKVSTFLSDDQYAMQEAIQAGVTDAIKESADAAQREIELTAETAREHILALEEEARRRSERLQRATAPSKIYNILKWVLLLLLIAIATVYLVQTLNIV